MSETLKLDNDRKLIGNSGEILNNGMVYFYDSTTLGDAPVYSNMERTKEFHQPVRANNNGVLPMIYLQSEIDYKLLICDREKSPVREIYPIDRASQNLQLINSIGELKSYKGKDDLILLIGKNGCPTYYKRKTGCRDLPKEQLPDVIEVDCTTVWIACKNKIDLCASEVAKLNCNYNVLVQECGKVLDSYDVEPKEPMDVVATSEADCGCGGASHESTAGQSVESAAVDKSDCGCNEHVVHETQNPIKRASIGQVLQAAIECLPGPSCIPHDAMELAIVGGKLVKGDRLPPPIQSEPLGAMFSVCIPVNPSEKADFVSRHLQLDKHTFSINGIQYGVKYATLKVTNNSSCTKRYEISAMNRLNRANEDPKTGADFGEVPIVNANYQTRLAEESNPLLNSVLAPTDHWNALSWLQDISIADTYMGPNRTGILFAAPIDMHPWGSATGFTENTLFTDIPGGGGTKTFALKVHIYWDMDVPNINFAERIHFGTRIIARQV